MTIPLVVGVDGSEGSLEAVDRAAGEAARHGVPPRLLHAAAGEREESEVVDAASARARKRAPAVPLSSEVSCEDAASALIDIGRSAFAPVLGSRGFGDLDGILLGSVSLGVVARADCPVVVVRGTVEHRDARFGSVVVGVEGGEGSGTAMDFARREAHVRRCRLVAVHAWSAPSGAPTTPQAPSWVMEAHPRARHCRKPRRRRICWSWAPAGDSGIQVRNWAMQDLARQLLNTAERDTQGMAASRSRHIAGRTV
ncbi:hypothetical protein GCM10010339_80500 [Streptomyces alanosinicus]|uniref:UspA domain-containing protein n=1 Tax=Streptomyces alanosinicus TaxID=68171 RepID=A0A918YTM3_9ACTN|nr:hypothetical protein GCM10010339_80500 [Streptomyces alanosinicus]